MTNQHITDSSTLAKILRDRSRHYWGPRNTIDGALSKVLKELADDIENEAVLAIQARGRLRRGALTVRPNPEQPSADELWELYKLNGMVDGGFSSAKGLAAVWRHGVDTGMVAP